jgi:hypothetical protein
MGRHGAVAGHGRCRGCPTNTLITDHEALDGPKRPLSFALCEAWASPGVLLTASARADRAELVPGPACGSVCHVVSMAAKLGYHG